MEADHLHHLHPYLIPCPFKWLTGTDCPGCGFQRSLLALFSGDFTGSFFLYPATIPFLIFCIAAVLQKWFRLDRKGIILKSLAIFTGSIMLLSYLFKLISTGL